MFDDSEYSDELEVALEAAEAAGEVIDEYADGEAEIQGSKSSPGDIYTEADIRAQERIVEVISESFPDDGFLAEEEMGYQEEGKAGRRWVIDPVDGTTNFQKGLDYFCTSIAFEVKGETRVGVVYSPESGLSSLFSLLCRDPGHTEVLLRGASRTYRVWRSVRWRTGGRHLCSHVSQTSMVNTEIRRSCGPSLQRKDQRSGICPRGLWKSQR